MSLSAAEADEFVVIFGNTFTQGSIDGSEEFTQIADSYATAEARALYKQKREEAEEKARAQKELQRLRYTIWLREYEAAFAETELIKTFPYLPKEACICTIEQCKRRGNDTGLLACRHDVELLLRASGSYSKTWLRSERLKWHPDQFGKKCDPAYRQRLCTITTELYSIFEELIASED